MLKIVLFGSGKMGRLIASIASEKHQVLAQVSCKNDADELKSLVEPADVVIDFSHATCMLQNIAICADLGKNMVIGTTGWDKDFPQAQNIILESQIGCIYEPNFSLGIHFFRKILSYTAQLSKLYPYYEMAGVEWHHSKKADAPSGTAKMLSEAAAPAALPFTSIRCGSIPGTHSIYLDSPCDTIVLTHEARNREGFARGAIQAAEWIKGKRGLFTIDDLINDLQKEDVCF